MSRTVLLELDLTRGLLESSPAEPVAALRSRRIPTVRVLVEHLAQAAQDDSVVGLVAQVGDKSLTVAQAQELGEAVERFGDSGRVTACWTESFGELAPRTVPYLFAAYCSEVWLQPSGSLGLLGVATRGIFLRRLLGRLGMEPQLGQRHEFKNAADLLMREDMSPAQREALQRVTDSVLDEVVATAARRRRLSLEQVREAVSSSPLSAQQAVDMRLVDRLGYRDELYDDLRSRLSPSGDVTLRYVERWRPQPVTTLRRQVARHRPTLAMVPVVGGIRVGRSGSSPVGGPHSGSDTVTAALRSAAKREDIRAVVLRVVSPGGSYVASDAVRQAVLRLRETGRPVVASMGTVAASGGYFVSMPCDEIVASPTTITGSIGVLGGKVSIQSTLQQAGVSVEPVSSGSQAAMFVPERPFDPVEWERVEAWLDQVYDDFTRKAAADRGVSWNQLEPLARGRVWTGADARDRGLVDRLGGLNTALDRAAQLAGVDRRQARLVVLPHVKPVNRLRPPKSSESPAAATASVAPEAAGVEALLSSVWSSLGVAANGVLTLPGSWELR